MWKVATLFVEARTGGNNLNSYPKNDKLILDYYITVKDELDLRVSSWINLRSQHWIVNEQKTSQKYRYSMIPIMKVL